MKVVRRIPTIELPSIKLSCCSSQEGEPDLAKGDGGAADQAAEMIEAAQWFRALGDPTRLTILRQLRDRGEVCACDFVACCAVAQPTVSHHLKVLREAGLVCVEKRGTWMFYRLNPSALARLRGFIP